MLWDSIMELGRSYENIMGLILFLPIGFLSWFPFVSEFQTRLRRISASSAILNDSSIPLANKLGQQSKAAVPSLLPWILLQ
jgi:callose synthase